LAWPRPTPRNITRSRLEVVETKLSGLFPEAHLHAPERFSLALVERALVIGFLGA
jgi:hypothetical protein